MRKGNARFSAVVCTAAVLVFTNSPHAGPAEDYDRGLKAYQEEDLVTAIQWLQSSSDAGHTPSQVLLAYILDKSEQNEEAFALYLQSAEKGDANGQAGLADMYAAGDGIEQDFEKAYHWYKKAAEGGHSRATMVLALAYLEGGLGLQANRALAIEWLRHGAERGDVPSQTMLNKLTENNTGDGLNSGKKEKTK